MNYNFKNKVLNNYKLILLLFFLFCNVISYSQASFKILVFTKTAGFYHSSIPDGVAAIVDLGQQNNFDVDHSDHDSVFTFSNLNQYAAIVFLNTTGDVLNSSQELQFIQYIQSGGGFVGVHSATDTEYGWNWYGDLVGTYFVSHPAIQSATLNIIDSTHSSTQNLPVTLIMTDEWYNFAVPFPSNLNVLISIDESSYTGGTMGAFHPVSWYHLYDGGRSFYTAMGHTSASYTEPFFLQHLLGGILWAANAATEIPDDNNETGLIVPSDVRDLISVNIPMVFPLNVELLDLKGKRIFYGTFQERINIDVKKLTCGLYLILIKGKSFRLARKIRINC